MATYADVWRQCEETFGRGTRFDVDVSGARRRDGTIHIEWTISHFATRGGEMEQIDAATADEVIARLKVLGETTSPADVGEIHPGLAASIASVTGEDNATKENRS